jgi:hypothetical protein
MKNILEQVLTNPEIRNTAPLNQLAMSEEAFEPWSS